MAARRLPGQWLVVVLAGALLVSLGAVVGLAATLLIASPSLNEKSSVDTPVVATLGRGVSAGHRWTLSGSLTSNLRCLTLAIEHGGRESACFTPGSREEKLGLNHFGRFAFGQVALAVTRVRVRVRGAHATIVPTHRSRSRILSGWRYYVAAIPPHSSLRRIEALSRSGHVIARTKP